MDYILIAAIITGVCAVIVTGFISEIIRNKRKDLFVAEISSWKELCMTAMEERDLLLRRIESRDCQKVLAVQERIDDLLEENNRLKKLNAAYKKEIDRRNENA